jgi:hypothetical protein
MMTDRTTTCHFEFRIGSLTLSEGYGGPEFIQIKQDSDEAGDFTVEAVEALLQAFYAENF